MGKENVIGRGRETSEVTKAPVISFIKSQDLFVHAASTREFPTAKQRAPQLQKTLDYLHAITHGVATQTITDLPTYGEIREQVGVSQTTLRSALNIMGNEWQTAAEEVKKWRFAPSKITAQFLGMMICGGEIREDTILFHSENEGLLQSYRKLGEQTTLTKPTEFQSHTAPERVVAFLSKDTIKKLGPFEKEEQLNTLERRHGWIFKKAYAPHFLAGMLAVLGEVNETDMTIVLPKQDQDFGRIYHRMLEKLEITEISEVNILADIITSLRTQELKQTLPTSRKGRPLGNRKLQDERIVAYFQEAFKAVERGEIEPSAFPRFYDAKRDLHASNEKIIKALNEQGLLEKVREIHNPQLYKTCEYMKMIIKGAREGTVTEVPLVADIIKKLGIKRDTMSRALRLMTEEWEQAKVDVAKQSFAPSRKTARFLGMMVSGGAIKSNSQQFSCTNEDENLLQVFKILGEEILGINAIETPKSPTRNKTVSIHSKYHGKALGPFQRGERGKTMQTNYRWVLDEYLKDFAAGVFEAGGTVSITETHKTLAFSSNDPELINFYRRMLNRLNIKKIHTRTNPEGIIISDMNEIRSFAEQIKSEIPAKKKLLEEMRSLKHKK